MLPLLVRRGLIILLIVCVKKIYENFQSIIRFQLRPVCFIIHALSKINLVYFIKGGQLYCYCWTLIFLLHFCNIRPHLNFYYPLWITLVASMINGGGGVFVLSVGYLMLPWSKNPSIDKREIKLTTHDIHAVTYTYSILDWK